VVSYSMAQRVRELAIRMALGASPGDLLRLVIGKMMLIVLVGLALGGSAALALLACYVPARRVTKVDPLAILRFE
jgi:ABC-type antimicrobial peptide transport system permease subunit